MREAEDRTKWRTIRETYVWQWPAMMMMTMIIYLILIAHVWFSKYLIQILGSVPSNNFNVKILNNTNTLQQNISLPVLNHNHSNELFQSEHCSSQPVVATRSKVPQRMICSLFDISFIIIYQLTALLERLLSRTMNVKWICIILVPLSKTDCQKLAIGM